MAMTAYIDNRSLLTALQHFINLVLLLSLLLLLLL